MMSEQPADHDGVRADGDGALAAIEVAVDAAPVPFDGSDAGAAANHGSGAPAPTSCEASAAGAGETTIAGDPESPEGFLEKTPATDEDVNPAAGAGENETHDAPIDPATGTDDTSDRNKAIHNDVSSPNVVPEGGEDIAQWDLVREIDQGLAHVRSIEGSEANAKDKHIALLVIAYTIYLQALRDTVVAEGVRNKCLVTLTSRNRKNFELLVAALFYPGRPNVIKDDARRDKRDRRSELATAIRFLGRKLADGITAGEVTEFILANGGVAGCASLERTVAKSDKARSDNAEASSAPPVPAEQTEAPSNLQFGILPDQPEIAPNVTFSPGHQEILLGKLAEAKLSGATSCTIVFRFAPDRTVVLDPDPVPMALAA
ncbi:MAG: hypothetical protein WCJ64_20910 [Rhodospirillaceae bacterium]